MNYVFRYTLFTKALLLFRISMLKPFIHGRINTSQILLGATIPVTLAKTQVKSIFIHLICKNFLPLNLSIACPQEKSSHKKNYAYLTDSEYFTCLLKKRSSLQHTSQNGHLYAGKTSCFFVVDISRKLSPINDYFQIPTFLIDEHCSRQIL